MPMSMKLYIELTGLSLFQFFVVGYGKGLSTLFRSQGKIEYFLKLFYKLRSLLFGLMSLKIIDNFPDLGISLEFLFTLPRGRGFKIVPIDLRT